MWQGHLHNPGSSARADKVPLAKGIQQESRCAPFLGMD